MNSGISEYINETIGVLNRLKRNQDLLRLIQAVSGICTQALRCDRKILFFGNGGSAADSQHLAAEMVSRFSFDRPGLPAFALTTDTSVLTAIGNDYGFDKIFSRQIDSVGNEGDVVFGFSTSGKSMNVVEGLEHAKRKGLVTVGMTGGHEDTLISKVVDYCIAIPSTNTSNIQEGHILVGHLICKIIEENMFKPSLSPDSKEIRTAVTS